MALGGGVYVIKGAFNMEGGTITGNESELGGGVYVDADAKFAMSGGEIFRNYKDCSVADDSG